MVSSAIGNQQKDFAMAKDSFPKTQEGCEAATSITHGFCQ